MFERYFPNKEVLQFVRNHDPDHIGLPSLSVGLYGRYLA
jgi:hypothetical protein